MFFQCEIRAKNVQILRVTLMKIWGWAEKSSYAGLSEKTEKFSRDSRPSLSCASPAVKLVKYDVKIVVNSQYCSKVWLQLNFAKFAPIFG